MFYLFNQVVALDVTREFYELGLPMIKKAGVIHKIDFREGLLGINQAKSTNKEQKKEERILKKGIRKMKRLLFIH
jgi:hypothetical protein